MTSATMREPAGACVLCAKYRATTLPFNMPSGRFGFCWTCAHTRSRAVRGLRRWILEHNVTSGQIRAVLRALDHDIRYGT